MDILRRDELNELVEIRSDICVSIYLPTHPSMPETQQDPIRFKNLLARAKDQLIEMSIETAKVDQLLRPAHAQSKSVIAITRWNDCNHAVVR
jgi:hypothetical protein